ncbi:hypothetical protein LWI29_034515 [Acer saccharum]|uniref:Uncharacterized protein n=1 Tax=Acer saccharum TaxID=4024 RepID=A0AA39VCR9_ACESA|nr:hypothetical protein LWI29_034515 [Acer saccharum]
MGALDCFFEFPLDDREAPLIKHESPDCEEIIAQLKEENRAVRALNFELTTKLEEALTGQDNLVDEFTIWVSSIEEETLQRDQLMRNKEELSIAKKGKGKKMGHLLNLNLDKVKRISAMPINSNPPPLQKKKEKIQEKEKTTQAPREEILRGMARTKRPHSKSQSAQVELSTEQRFKRGKATVPRSSSKHPNYDQRLRQNRNRSLVVERGLDFKDLASTSFIAEVHRRHSVTYCTIRNPANVTVVHTITLGPAVLLYLMKMELPFDVDIVAIKRIAEAGRTNVPSMSFPCLITYFCERASVRFDIEDELRDGGVVGTKAYNEVAVPIGFPKLESEKLKKRRLQREIREAKKASVVAGIGTRGEPSASRDVPPPRRATAPRGSSEQITTDKDQLELDAKGISQEAGLMVSAELRSIGGEHLGSMTGTAG